MRGINGPGYSSNKTIHGFVITDTGWWIHEIHFSTFLMFKKFFIIKVFFFLFFLTTWMGSFVSTWTNPITVSHALGFPCCILTKSKPDMFERKCTNSNNPFPPGQVVGSNLPKQERRGIRAPFGGASPDPSLLHLWPERGPPSSWVFPSCCLEWNPGPGSYSLLLEETPQIQWGLSL